MPSLLELVERVNKGELIDSALLEVYQESSNAAEKFLANHARAMLDLRRSHTYLLEALEAIDYADQKVLFQFLAVLGFLGLSDQRAAPVIKFGAAAISRREVSLGLEAIQSGIAQDAQSDNFFTRDRANSQLVAEQYDRAAQAIGWFPPGPCDWTNTQLKIGYLTSSLGDDDAAARLLMGVSKHTDPKDVKFCVYSTEANVRREKLSFAQGPFTPASAKRGKETIETLNRRKASVWLAPLDQDVATCAKELGQQIFKDQIDVLIIDANLADPIASVVANWQIARAKLNLVRRSPMLAGAVDAALYVDANLKKQDEPFWRKKCTDTHFLQEGVEPLSGESSVTQRTAYGIPEQSIILATTPDADGKFDEQFLDAAVQILRQHPQTVLLVAGDADQQQVRRRLDSAGLSKRVGFAGKRKDLADFLRMADIYLAGFPRHNMSALSAGRAVAAMAGESSDPQCAQHVVGDEHVVSDVPAYVDRVGKLIRDPALRNQAGESGKNRAAAQFGYEHTARALEQICRNLLSTDQPHRAAA
jgi:predicted O-linked N-acetylglucosamine transferase (SPINDLY family)